MLKKTSAALALLLTVACASNPIASSGGNGASTASPALPSLRNAPDYVLLAANHHAVTSIESPDTAAGAHVHVVDSITREFLGASDIVNVIGITAVDQKVLCLEMRKEIRDTFVHHRRWNH